MKALAMVAHPDDCIIFGYGFINHYKNFDWSICYLTYTNSDPRAIEISKFWSRRNIETKFLGFIDDYQDIKNNQISFSEDEAKQSVLTEIADKDLILTHNQYGEYGHLHHKFIHNIVIASHPCVVTFADSYHGNATYTVDSSLYSLDELPLHRDVIGPFHPVNHINNYQISPEVNNRLLNL